MLAKIVPIGNSKGIRIPAAIIKQLQLKEEVEFNVVDNEKIIIQPKNLNPRKNWDASFKSMHKNKDDKNLLGDLDSDSTFEWEW